MGKLLLHEYSLGYSLNCDEAMFGVQNSSLNMFWEYSPNLMNVVSEWLRAESSPVDEEEIKMDDGVARYFTRFGGLFCCC